MARRTLELIVDGDGRVVWDEGTFELGPTLAPGAFTGLPPETLVEVVGEYRRVDARTRIVRVTTPPRVLATPVQRALAGWRDQALIARLEPVLPATGDALAVLAARALALGDRALAEQRFVAALRAGVSDAADGPLAAVWPVPDLDAAARLRLATHVWNLRAGGAWIGVWIEPFVHEVRCDHVHPMHFGGPRVVADLAVVAAWVDAQFVQLATDAERAAIAELRAATPARRRAYLRDVEKRDAQMERDAYRKVLARHARHGDPQDSPPDSSGLDSDDYEERTLVARWVRFVEEQRTDLHGAGYALLELARKRRGIDGARAQALAADAAVILSGLAPALVPDVVEVAVVDAQLARGLAVVRLAGDDRFARLAAPEGYFGAWELRTGTWAEVGEGPLVARGAPARGAVLPPRDERPPRPVRPVRPEPSAPAERFVVHATFGRGKVVQAIGSGADAKLVIEFATGARTLLARFVQDA